MIHMACVTRSLPLLRDCGCEQYECGNPGAPVSHHEGLSGCSWSFGLRVPTYSGDMSQYVRLVKPEDYENVSVCLSLGLSLLLGLLNYAQYLVCVRTVYGGWL